MYDSRVDAELPEPFDPQIINILGAAKAANTRIRITYFSENGKEETLLQNFYVRGRVDSKFEYGGKLLVIRERPQNRTTTPLFLHRITQIAHIDGQKLIPVFQTDSFIDYEQLQKEKYKRDREAWNKRWRV